MCGGYNTTVLGNPVNINTLADEEKPVSLSQAELNEIEERLNLEQMNDDDNEDDDEVEDNTEEHADDDDDDDGEEGEENEGNTLPEEGDTYEY